MTRRFYPQGEEIEGTAYFYNRDHLGSIREMVDNAGAVKARYDYDLWGNRSANLFTGSGAMESDFGFTGHYYHGGSKLHLAPYRAYDADLGRWLSRDPIDDPMHVLAVSADGYMKQYENDLRLPVEITVGANFYDYVFNNPASLIDPLGLWGVGAYGGGTAYAGIGVVGAGATGSVGGGYFSGTGIGGFASGGAFAGTPWGGWGTSGATGNFAAGGFAGAGGGGYATSASSPCDLKAMKSYSLDVGVGPLKLSINLGLGGGNWMAGVSFGPGYGLGVSRFNTSTITTN